MRIGWSLMFAAFLWALGWLLIAPALLQAYHLLHMSLGQ